MSELLTRIEPAAVEDVAFGETPLRCHAHLGDTELPDDLILSIRCIVSVGNQIVVCTTIDGSSHPFPGGRREPGETFAETAAREVLEETGWRIDPATLRHLGWLHFAHTTPMTNPAYPWPDFFQLVFTAEATERAAAEWTDTEGYEASSQLLSLADALIADFGETPRVYLNALRVTDDKQGPTND